MSIVECLPTLLFWTTSLKKIKKVSMCYARRQQNENRRNNQINGYGLYRQYNQFKHTIKLIRELTSEIDEIEVEIKSIMDEINSPILSIPEISYNMGARIIAEIGDFNRFDSADKILAYAGMSPSTDQSGQLDNCYSHMEKRGSRYLRYALYNATKYVCHWDESFGTYFAKKRAEGKHYNVALPDRQNDMW